MPDTLRKPATTLARWLAKVQTGTDEECWPWLAATNPAGYGVLQVSVGTNRYRTALAHRLAYKFFVGYVPDDLYVLHRCDNPPCCNPAHLFVGTAQDNSDDCVSKGRTAKGPKGVTLANLAKTHCPKGHPYSGDNLRLRENGGRGCRTCDRESADRHRRRTRETP